MRKCFLYLLVIVATNSQAQPSIQWKKTLGGSATETVSAIRSTNDGGLIIAANSTSLNGNVSGIHIGLLGPTQPDFWIVKLDNNQNIQWQRCLGSSLKEDVKDIQLTNDGGYIITGTTSAITSTQDVIGNHGGLDAWVVKLDNAGNVQWQKCLGGKLNDLAWSIQNTSDGGFVVAGSTTSVDGDVSGNHGAMDFWVVKLDNNGNIQWQKCLGGSKDEEARSIRHTTDGGYLVAGYTYSNDCNVILPNGKRNTRNSDYWIVKLNSVGNIQWQKSLGGSKDELANLALPNANGILVVGYSNSNDNEVSGHHGNTGNKPSGDPTADYWIVQLNNNGNIVWQRSLGGIGNDIGFSAALTEDGGSIIAGLSNSNDGDVSGNHGSNDYWILKLTGAGTISWQKSLGGTLDDHATCLQLTSDGGVIVGGSSRSNDGDVSDNHGNSDGWIVKLGGNNSRVMKTNPQFVVHPLQVYPNPSSDYINFQLDPSTELNEMKLSVYTISGNITREIIIQSPSTRLFLNGWPKGVYTYKIGKSGRTIYTGKIIVR